MEKLITVAEFPNSFDIKFALFRDMLDEAEIGYVISNENARNLKPFPISPSNISIEIKVYEKDVEEAVRIFQSIV